MTNTELTDFMTEVQRQSLAAVKQTQGIAVRATELATSFVPEPTARLMRELVPPREVVDAGFAFARDLLELQKNFTLRLVTAIEGAPAEAAAKN